MQNARLKIASLVAVLAVAGTVLFFSRSRPEVRRDVPSTPPATPPVAQAPPPSVTPAAPALALRDRYSLEYRMKMKSPEGDASFLLLGTLDVSKPRAGEDVRMAVMSDVKLTTSGPQLAGQDTAALYSKPWRLRFRSDGGLSDVTFAEGTPQLVRSAFAQVATLAQLTAATSRDAKTWAATESDANATYSVRYERKSASKIEKTFGAVVPANSIDVYDANGKAELVVTNDTIDAVTAELVQHVRLAKDVIDARVDIVLKRPPGAIVAMSETQTQALSSAGPFRSFDANALQGPSQADEDRTRVAGRSFERIVQDIEKAEQIHNWQLRKSYGFDLAALMRLEPKTVPLTVSAIRAQTVEPVRRTLIESLGNARTPVAQSGLKQLMVDGAPDVANDARNVSAFVDATDELLDQLTKDSEAADGKIARPASFALAASLGRRYDKEIKDDRLKQFLSRGEALLADYGITPVKELVTSGEVELQPAWEGKRPGRKALDWLQLLGATHSRESLPLLGSAIRSSNQAVRAEAVLAIRYLSGDEPALLISERALKDPIHFVRAHAVTALSDLGEERGLATVKQVLTKDREPSVRAEAASAIGRWSITNPELKRILNDALEREESELVVNAILDQTVPGRGYQKGTPQRVTLGGKL